MKRSIFIFIILLLISGCNDINGNKEDVIVTQDDNLDFANFIVDKLVNSLRDENYDYLMHLYIYPTYGDQDKDKMIKNLLNNYKAKMDLETLKYEYTGEIKTYQNTKDVNYYKYRLYDIHGNQHYIEIGVISNIATINDSMFNIE